jgi:hypothetical protein
MGTGAGDSNPNGCWASAGLREEEEKGRSGWAGSGVTWVLTQNKIEKRNPFLIFEILYRIQIHLNSNLSFE